MKQEVVYCGIDVAKEQLDVALGPKRWQVPNTKQGVGQLVKQLKAERSKVHAICEASGGYEKAIVIALQKSALAVSLVQANRVRQLHAQLAFWPRPTRSTPPSWCISAGPCTRLPTQRSRSKSLVCASWMHSAGT